MMRSVALVLGAGQIGVAAAAALRDDFIVHVHCRRPESATAAAREIDVPVDRTWYGDLAFGENDLGGITLLHAGSAGAERAVDGGVAGHRIRLLIDAVRPDVVVDAMNIATTAASAVSVGREGMQPSPEAAIGIGAQMLCNRAVALHRALRGGVRSYVRISTTGTGRRGLELPFTHGDSGSFMSPALWRKILFSGIEHQLLWALARTFPGQVRLVVPAAFVGFEDWDRMSNSGSDGGQEPTVRAGEDKSYTAAEIAVLSSHRQMGAVTREEVAGAVHEIVTGRSFNHDMLSAMSNAALWSSYAGLTARDFVLNWMQRSTAADQLQVASGSLGDRVSFALLVLRLLRHVQPEELRSWTPDAVHGFMRLPPHIETEANRVGLHLGTSHGAVVGSRSHCLCTDCLSAVVREILGVITFALQSDDPVERLLVVKLVDDPGWSEGDLLALLWQGDRAESSRL
jgi:hypothetical protein